MEQKPDQLNTGNEILQIQPDFEQELEEQKDQEDERDESIMNSSMSENSRSKIPQTLKISQKKKQSVKQDNVLDGLLRNENKAKKKAEET